VTDKSGVAPFSTSILCSGTPSGKTAIVISQNGKILDALESESESYDFDDAGVFTISCYPDVVNDRTNVCKTTVSVSGECGNGVEESDEQCDDGNTTSGDGCNNLCQSEADDGSVCGNGIKEAKEQCDDGNNVDGDTCTSICQNTTPRTGPIATLFVMFVLSVGGAGYYLYYRKRKNIV
jgi:cysteine-rich repeat protein